jgi:hypothetical protein
MNAGDAVIANIMDTGMETKKRQKIRSLKGFDNALSTEHQ